MKAPIPPSVVGVIGGGIMGAGIAQIFAAAGAFVPVVEADDESAREAYDRIRRGVSESARRGKLTGSVEDVLGRVDVGVDADRLAGAELVVEAVPERADLKVAVLTAAERAVVPDAVLATNTSALSVTELSATLERPYRFLGLHFINPVPASRLVEVVVAPATTDAVRDRAVVWTHAVGKTEIVVRDSPGFATSRLGVALGLEAIRMLEEGVADAESIDRAMKLGYRHPTGPLRLTDLVGLDVRLAIADYLTTVLGARFRPPQLLRDKVARGELGRKSGRGFFTRDTRD